MVLLPMRMPLPMALSMALPVRMLSGDSGTDAGARAR